MLLQNHKSRIYRDNLTPEQRRLCMSRVKGKDTGLEKKLRAELDKLGIMYETYRKDLPGKPDFVFAWKKIVVFVDGDFWHGYRFPSWKHSLSPFWQEKIGKTRARDQRNFRKLRRMGWQVIRIWQHEMKRDLGSCIDKIKTTLDVTN